MTQRSVLLAVSLSALGLGFAPQKDPRDADAKLFLDEANKILREDPEDGRFGVSRLPTVHGRQYFDNRKEKEKPIAAAWQRLESENYMALATYGEFKDGALNRMRTMSGHYQLNWAPLVKDNRFLDAESEFHRLAKEEATKLYTSKKERTRTIVFDYVDRKAKLDLRAIFPSSKACLSCHKNVRAGEPIGIMALVRVPKALK